MVSVNDRMLLWGMTLQTLLRGSTEYTPRELTNMTAVCDLVLEMAEKRFGEEESQEPSKVDAEPASVTVDEKPAKVADVSSPTKRNRKKSSGQGAT